MKVTLANTFHGTQSTLDYPGGVYAIPEEVLAELCPDQWCTCLGTPYGFPKVVFTGGVAVDLDERNDFVLKPAD